MVDDMVTDMKMDMVADIEVNMFPYVPSADGTADEVGGPVELVDRAVPNLSQVVYSAKARQNPELPREYRVDVEIRWTSGGVQREKKLTWILLKEITFGQRLRRRLVEKSGGTAGKSVK